ncbi:glutamine synthetase [Astrocystis sublimbata]|nr:glutamine synthetase [Astrocystis sublimbata]
MSSDAMHHETSYDKKRLEYFLHTHPSTKYIRLQWVDYSGVLRTRFVPIDRCLRIASGSEHVRLAQNSMLIPISTAPRIFSLSDYHETWSMIPDWSSLRMCGFRDGHASVMSFVDQHDAATRFDKCPRRLLVDALHRLKQDYGAEAVIGFEIEFMLLDELSNLIKPLDRLNGYSRTAGLRAETLDLVEEIIDALEKSSVNIHHFHAEALDQLEIALAPETALNAVDSLILAQETIRTICVRRKLKATMAPKAILSAPSNGLHLHLSLPALQHGSRKHFLAGILNHMRSLCAFGMAKYDSYGRSASDAAGAWIGFGTDNRDMPVRKIDDQHWELRMMDATANPYLFTAAAILTCLDGLEKTTELVWKDCKFFPDSMTKESLSEHGIKEAMPTSLKEALAGLKADKDMTSVMGDLADWFISVKDKEVEEFSKMSEEQRRLRFLEYF